MIRFRDRELATIGERVAELRQKAGLTQSELAARIGVTQGYISRLETGGKLQQMNPHLLEAIIEGLEVEKGEALRGTHMERLVLDEVIDEDSGQHMHYCPNPFCSRNEIRRTPVRTYAIAWKSAERVSRPEFAQVEFCGHCGTRLVKVCPHCGKRIRKAPEYFCCRCGRQIHDRPNGPERKLR
jgi:transcriptional regulator with XRE-family HTH domain